MIRRKTLTTSGSNCRVLQSAPPAGPFRSTIGSAFHEWIRGHWGLAGTALLSPAKKDFLKPARLFDFHPRPSRDRVSGANYTLLSLVQMKLALGVSNRMFFDGAKYVNNQMPAARTVDQPFVRASTTSILREFWLSLNPSHSRESGRNREPRRRRALSLVNWKRWPVGNEPGQGTGYREPGLREFVGTSFINLFHATERWLRFLRVTSVRGANGSQALQLRTKSRSLNINPASIAADYILKAQSWVRSSLVLHQIVNATFNAGEHPSKPWSLPGLIVPRGRIQVSLAAGAYGLAPLKLVVPQGVSTEVETNTRTRFFEASTMYFARQESQVVEKLVSALKDLRETQTQIKPVAQPQVEIQQLTRQVYQQLERELRIEKERRGR